MKLKILGDYCFTNDILFCVDAIQSMGAHAIDVEDCHADFVVADGHKWMLGPEGVALFYCRKSTREILQLNQFGWHMVEDFLNFDSKQWKIANNGRRFECGSPNMLGIHGLHASLSLILEVGVDKIHEAIELKLNLIINKLKQLPDINIITPIDSDRRSGILTFRSNKIDTATIFNHLIKNNIFCAMRAGGIRLSPHYYTPNDKIEEAIKTIESLHR